MNISKLTSFYPFRMISFDIIINDIIDIFPRVPLTLLNPNVTFPKVNVNDHNLYFNKYFKFLDLSRLSPLKCNFKVECPIMLFQNMDFVTIHNLF